MGIYQIFALLVFAGLLLNVGIRGISLIKTDFFYREERLRKESKFKGSLISLLATLVVFMFCSILLTWGDWSFLKITKTPPKKIIKVVELKPVMDEDIYVLQDKHFSYLLTEDDSTIKSSGRYINYDADGAPYAETYKTKMVWYLTADTNQKWPIYIEGPRYGYIIHLRDIDQVKKINASYLASWD